MNYRELLKNCPFCTAEADMMNFEDSDFWAECENCGASGAMGNTPQQAILLWNMRGKE